MLNQVDMGTYMNVLYFNNQNLAIVYTSMIQITLHLGKMTYDLGKERAEIKNLDLAVGKISYTDLNEFLIRI